MWRKDVELPVTYKDILSGLKALGIGNGDLLAVHSSLKSMGRVEGGPETVVEALKSAVGRRGTLLMPVFTPPSDVFYVNDAPSTTGIITETLRHSPGTVRSLHPTHSVAVWGRYARNLARDHHKHEALGVNSPFHRLARRGGKVLFIGVDFTKASLVHVAESVARAPYQDIFYPNYRRRTTLVAANGRRIRYMPKENPGDSSGFLVLQEHMRKKGLLVTGRLGRARVILVDARQLIANALELLSRDGAILLCRKPRCPVCPERRKKVQRLGWRYSG